LYDFGSFYSFSSCNIDLWGDRHGRPDSSSLGFTMHKFRNFVGSWEALVNELEVIVVELRMVLEVVFFALKEFVDLGQPRAIECVSLGLWSMMDVVLISKVLVIVVHVLAGVNVEVLLLGIVDFEEFSLDGTAILSKVSTNNWTVHISGLIHQKLLVYVTNEEHVEISPALGHSSESTNIVDGLKTEVKTEKP